MPNVLPPEIHVVESPDGVTVTVPAAGLWRGTRGLFPFSLLWCAFTVVFTVVLSFADAFENVGAWAAVLVLVAFWAAGLGMVLFAFNMGRRQAAFAVVQDTLLVLQTGPLGIQRREWRRGEVADVRTGPSGIEVNDMPVLELQIVPRAGKRVGLLAGRDEAELQWLATLLRRSLSLPAASEPSDPVHVRS
jgi:hypothetical protein